jgi:hypothetical protein
MPTTKDPNNEINPDLQTSPSNNGKDNEAISDNESEITDEEYSDLSDEEELEDKLIDALSTSQTPFLDEFTGGFAGRSSYTLIAGYFPDNDSYKYLQSVDSEGYGNKIPPHITPTKLVENEKLFSSAKYVKAGRGIPYVLPMNFSSKDCDFLRDKNFQEAGFEEKLEKFSIKIAKMLLPNIDPTKLHNLKFVYDGHGSDDDDVPYISNSNQDNPVYISYFALAKLMQKIQEKLSVPDIVQDNPELGTTLLKTRLSIRACHAAKNKEFYANSKLTPPTVNEEARVLREDKTFQNVIEHNTKETVTIPTNSKKYWDNMLSDFKEEEIDSKGLTPESIELQKEYQRAKHIYNKEGAVGMFAYVLGDSLYKVKGGNFETTINGANVFTPSIGIMGQHRVVKDDTPKGKNSKIITMKQEEVEDPLNIMQDTKTVLTGLTFAVSQFSNSYIQSTVDELVEEKKAASTLSEETNKTMADKGNSAAGSNTSDPHTR